LAQALVDPGGQFTPCFVDGLSFRERDAEDDVDLGFWTI
jgi:hypothetical protein